MLRKLFASIGLGAAATPKAALRPPYSPYTSEAANTIYNLLFCDDHTAFQSQPGTSAAPWQKTLFSAPSNVSGIQALAADTSQEGRIRYLAFERLRALGKTVPPKTILAVIVEVPLASGLDTLAAFSEGGVRYVNQSGKLLVIEGVADVLPLVKRLIAASEPVVSR